MTTATTIPSSQDAPAIATASRGQALVAPADPGGDQREHDRGDADPDRPHLEVRAGDAQVQVRQTEKPDEDRRRRHQPGERVEPSRLLNGASVDHRLLLARATCGGSHGDRRAVRATPRPIAIGREAPAGPRVVLDARRAERGLERRGLRPDRPPDHEAEVDHRDLEDDSIQMSSQVIAAF